MVLIDNGCQVNTVSPKLVEVHCLEAGLTSDLVTGKVCMVGLGGMHTPFGLHHYKDSSRWRRGLGQRSNSPYHNRFI